MQVTRGWIKTCTFNGLNEEYTATTTCLSATQTSKPLSTAGSLFIRGNVLHYLNRQRTRLSSKALMYHSDAIGRTAGHSADGERK